MGEIGRAGRTGKKIFEKFLKEFPATLKVEWTVITDGEYDDFSQSYIGSNEQTITKYIDAILEKDSIEYKYKKYGVNSDTDLIAMVRIEQEIYPAEAFYYESEFNNIKYKLKAIHPEGHYGTKDGVKLFAYKLLHLTTV